MAQSPINRPLWSHCPFLRQKSPRCVSKFNDFVKIISKLSFSFRIFLLCGEKKFRWLSFCGFKIWKIWPIKMRNLNSPSCLWTLSLSLSLSLSLFVSKSFTFVFPFAAVSCAPLFANSFFAVVLSISKWSIFCLFLC